MLCLRLHMHSLQTSLFNVSSCKSLRLLVYCIAILQTSCCLLTFAKAKEAVSFSKIEVIPKMAEIAVDHTFLIRVTFIVNYQYEISIVSVHSQPLRCL